MILFLTADSSDINGRRYVDPYPAQQMQDSPRRKRSTVYPVFDKSLVHEAGANPHPLKIHAYSPEKYTSYFSNNVKGHSNPKLYSNMS